LGGGGVGFANARVVRVTNRVINESCIANVD
jgi:hypothetical protein